MNFISQNLTYNIPYAINTLQLTIVAIEGILIFVNKV